MNEAREKLTRRQFGKATGALVLAFTLAPRLAGAQAPKLPGSLANNRMLDAWLRINADGSATIFSRLTDSKSAKAPSRPPMGASSAMASSRPGSTCTEKSLEQRR